MWYIRLHRYMRVDEAEELSDIKPYLESLGLHPKIVKENVQGLQMVLPLGWKAKKELTHDGFTFKVSDRQGTELFSFRPEGRIFLIHHRPVPPE